jgi:hypothetical protein
LLVHVVHRIASSPADADHFDDGAVLAMFGDFKFV